ncbi:unnamed protein product [Moneuplotes crassus]|uniref:Uncharacterized protein n=1 Tax=Euplotes crassus TaxID=5936 RepID=A0AAD1U406_EUPCR|nr:unnamed protein product [Moneuplotes crassus]
MEFTAVGAGEKKVQSRVEGGREEGRRQRSGGLGGLKRFERGGDEFRIIDQMYEEQMGEMQAKVFEKYEKGKKNCTKINLLTKNSPHYKISNHRKNSHPKVQNPIPTPQKTSKLPKVRSKMQNSQNSKINYLSSLNPTLCRDSRIKDLVKGFTSFYKYKKGSLVRHKGFTEVKQREKMSRSLEECKRFGKRFCRKGRTCIRGGRKCRDEGVDEKKEFSEVRNLFPKNSQIPSIKLKNPERMESIKKCHKTIFLNNIATQRSNPETISIHCQLEDINDSLIFDEITEDSEDIKLTLGSKYFAQQTNFIPYEGLKPTDLASVRHKGSLSPRKEPSLYKKFCSDINGPLRSKNSLPTQENKNGDLSALMNTQTTKVINSSKFITRNRISNLGKMSLTPEAKLFKRNRENRMSETKTLGSPKRSLNEIERADFQRNKIFYKHKNQEAKRIQNLCKLVGSVDRKFSSRIDQQIKFENQRQDKLNDTLDIISKLEEAPAFLLKKFYEYRVENMQQEKEFAVNVCKQYKSSLADPSRPISLKKHGLKHTS